MKKQVLQSFSMELQAKLKVERSSTSSIVPFLSKNGEVVEESAHLQACKLEAKLFLHSLQTG